MARVTVEDCIEKTDGVFSLIRLASQRARRLANGAETLLENGEMINQQFLLCARLLMVTLIIPSFIKPRAI